MEFSKIASTCSPAPVGNESRTSPRVKLFLGFPPTSGLSPLQNFREKFRSSFPSGAERGSEIDSGQLILYSAFSVRQPNPRGEQQIVVLDSGNGVVDGTVLEGDLPAMPGSEFLRDRAIQPAALLPGVAQIREKLKVPGQAGAAGDLAVQFLDRNGFSAPQIRSREIKRLAARIRLRGEKLMRPEITDIKYFTAGRAIRKFRLRIIQGEYIEIFFIHKGHGHALSPRDRNALSYFVIVSRPASAGLETRSRCSRISKRREAHRALREFYRGNRQVQE
ncbi:MAG: hypothetical protein ACRD4Y_01645 [Candidatus Acidiferrales bacterium]